MSISRQISGITGHKWKQFRFHENVPEAGKIIKIKIIKKKKD